MTRLWISPGSTTTGSVVDPLCAACERGFVPDTLIFVQNPKVAAGMEKIAEIAEETVGVYGEVPDVRFENTEEETDFAGYYEIVRDTIEEAKDNGAEVAINMTPGRKYMSGIAMQTGVQKGADHVFYLLIETREHYGEAYPNIPSTATELYDFTEEV